MFTMTFTRERHVEELRAELRACLDPREADEIRTELEAMLKESLVDQGRPAA